MENAIEIKVKQYLRDWYKKGYIKRSKMMDYIGTTVPMLTNIGYNSKNGRCIAVVADYICYFVEVLPSAKDILSDLLQSDRVIYNEVMNMLTLKDLVKLTGSDKEILNNKNEEKVQKSLKTKLTKQLKASIEEVKKDSIN